MDWCRANIGVGLRSSADSQRPIPFSLKEPLLRTTTEQFGYLPNNLLKLLLLNLLDSPAYSNLSTDYLENRFNPSTPDRENVKYFSIAAQIPRNGLSIIHPLWLPALLIDKLGGPEQGGHDGLVTVESARWGDFLGVVQDTDHWEIRGSSAFGSSVHESDGLLNQRAKSNWIELNRYISSWLFSNNRQGHHPDHPGRRSDTEKVSGLERNSLGELDPRHYQIQDQNSSVRVLADWIVKKLPLNLVSQSSGLMATTTNHPTYSKIDRYKNLHRTINPGFPLDDLELADHHDPGKTNHQSQKFDLERFYLAVCKNLHDHGLWKKKEKRKERILFGPFWSSCAWPIHSGLIIQSFRSYDSFDQTRWSKFRPKLIFRHRIRST